MFTQEISQASISRYETALNNLLSFRFLAAVASPPSSLETTGRNYLDAEFLYSTYFVRRYTNIDISGKLVRLMGTPNRATRTGTSKFLPQTC